MKMKIFKIVMTSLCVASALALSLYALNYYTNEQRIRKLQDNVFINNSFQWLGFLEPWVEHYNQGISLQRQKLYSEAIEEYDKALDSNIPWEDACWVRINKVLSITAPILPEAIDLTNIDDTISTLEGCLEILSEDDCATEDGDGHDEDAQQLYDDIAKWIEELKKQKEEMEKEEEEEEEGDKDKDDQNNQGNNQDQNQDPNNGNQDPNKDPNGGQDPNNGNNGGDNKDPNQDPNNGNQDPNNDPNQNGDGDGNGNGDGDEEQDGNSSGLSDYEQQLAQQYADLQNQAYTDRVNGGVGTEKVDPSDYQGVEEYW